MGLSRWYLQTTLVMKKKLLLLSRISIALVLFLFLSFPVSASQLDSLTDVSVDMNMMSVEAFVKNEIDKLIETAGPLCTWNEDTKLGQPVILYDADDVCNGYIYKLYTGNVETGYIQVNYFDGELCVYCYSFTGVPAYEGLSENIEPVIDEENHKLYFFGNMVYCHKLENGLFRAINGVEEFTTYDAQTYYQEVIEQIEQKQLECTDEQIELESLEKSNARATQSFTLVTTSDFANLYATRPDGTRQKVVEHCSPTAATNIMLYFRESGDSSLSTSLSNNTIFMELYYAMDTNSISTSNEITATGTYWSNIEPGISNSCNNRGCTPSTIGKVTSITYSGIKQHLDDGELLQIELRDFHSEGMNHSVVAFDYSGNYLSLSTGWDTDYHSYLYSGLTMGHGKRYYIDFTI